MHLRNPLPKHFSPHNVRLNVRSRAPPPCRSLSLSFTMSLFFSPSLTRTGGAWCTAEHTRGRWKARNGRVLSTPGWRVRNSSPAPVQSQAEGFRGGGSGGGRRGGRGGGYSSFECVARSPSTTYPTRLRSYQANFHLSETAMVFFFVIPRRFQDFSTVLHVKFPQFTHVIEYLFSIWGKPSPFSHHVDSIFACTREGRVGGTSVES